MIPHSGLTTVASVTWQSFFASPDHARCLQHLLFLLYSKTCNTQDQSPKTTTPTDCYSYELQNFSLLLRNTKITWPAKLVCMLLLRVLDCVLSHLLIDFDSFGLLAVPGAPRNVFCHYNRYDMFGGARKLSFCRLVCLTPGAQDGYVFT